MSIITELDSPKIHPVHITYSLKPSHSLQDARVSNLKDHIPSWLSIDLTSDLQHLVNQLKQTLTAKSTPSDYRHDSFLTQLHKATAEDQHAALYLLMSDVDARSIFIQFLLENKDSDFSLHNSVKNILFGKYNEELLMTFYGSEASLRQSELKQVSLIVYGEIFGQIAATWNRLSSGKSTFVKTVNLWITQSIFWVKSLYEIDDSTGISPKGLVEYLVDNYYHTILELTLYPKDRLLDDKNYFLFHQPILQLLLQSPKGVQLFREILNYYGQSKCWDNKFLNQILFVDKKPPCDQSANTGYLERVFSAEYALSDECRKFVISSGTCFVPMIARIVKSPPPFSTRLGWQQDLVKLFSQGNNKKVYESSETYFRWAFHFAEIPADAFGILNHYIDFKIVLEEFLNSDLIKNFNNFRLIFDFVSSDPKLFQFLRETQPELTKKAFEFRTIDLYKSFLLPPMTQQEKKCLMMVHPAVSLKYTLHTTKRFAQSFVSSILRQKETPYFNETIENLLGISRKFSDDEQPVIFRKFLENTIPKTNMFILKLFDQMNEQEAVNFIKYLWTERILNESLYEKMFTRPARSLVFPPYKKFIQAVDILDETEDIRTSLKISDQQPSELPFACFISRGEANPSAECSIQ